MERGGTIGPFAFHDEVRQRFGRSHLLNDLQAIYHHPSITIGGQIARMDGKRFSRIRVPFAVSDLAQALGRRRPDSFTALADRDVGYCPY